jgi:hypothetical protein
MGFRRIAVVVGAGALMWWVLRSPPVRQGQRLQRGRNLHLHERLGSGDLHPGMEQHGQG